MARIAVWFAPLEVSRDFIDYPYFADLGAVQAAAVLRAAGHQVQVYDALATRGATLSAGPSTQEKLVEPDTAAHGSVSHATAQTVILGVGVEQLLASASDYDLALVAYTPFQRPPSRDRLLGQLLSGLRQRAPRAPIVLADLYQSGQHVVDAPSQQIAAAYPEIDGLLRYEAEGWLVPWVNELLARSDDVNAPSQRAAPQIRDGNHGPEIDLDKLPLPAWDLVDTGAYFAFHRAVMAKLGRPRWAFPIDRDHLPMLSSRGCPFRCAHCSSNPGLPSGKPKTQRRYSPARLAAHLDWLKAQGARSVHLLDELANVSERHFDALTELLAERDLHFEIPNGVRADYVLPKHLAAMRGRLSTLSISAESGVQRVVDQVVGKQLDLTAIVKTAERAHAAGVPLMIHYIIGMPGETRAEINGTLEFALDLYDRFRAEPSVQFATPLPGTRLAREALERGASALPVVQDWGPYFQVKPSLETELFQERDLLGFRYSLDARLAASRAPAQLTLPVTYRCNNRCAFCPTGTGRQIDGDFDAQRRLLAEFRRQGASELYIDGGEPTLYRKLVALIRFARSIGYQQISVVTNGRMLMYEAYAEQLLGSGISGLVFSLHGATQEIHTANVGDPEAFAQTLQGIQTCARLVKATGSAVELGINVTITRSNYLHLGAIAERAKSLGVGRLNLLFLTPGADASLVSPPLSAAVGRVAELLTRFEQDLALSVLNLPPCYLPGHTTKIAPDLLKLGARRYVSPEGVQLDAFHEAHRAYNEQCAGCHHRVACGGFYALGGAAERHKTDFLSVTRSETHHEFERICGPR